MIDLRTPWYLRLLGWPARRTFRMNPRGDGSYFPAWEYHK